MIPATGAGANSERNIAVKTLTGTASRRVTPVITSVPMIKTLIP